MRDAPRSGGEILPLYAQVGFTSTV